MRIVQITTSVNWGAVGRIAEQIGEHVLAEGGESYIIYGRYSNPSSSTVIRVGNKISFIVNYACARLFDMEGLSAWHSTKKLIKRLKEINPDIVHLHNIHGYYLNYKILFEYLNSTNIPIVWTFHDCWPFTGHCSHFVSANCRKWIKECEKCPLLNQYPKSPIFDGSRRNFRLKKSLFTESNNIHIVAVSEWMASLVELSFFKKKDIRIIHNGVDLNVFKPQNEHISDCCTIIGVASVWTEKKGLFDFFSLRNLLDINNYRIILVGLNSEQVKKLPSGIEGIERTDSIHQLAHLYSIADVFVNLTYEDTFPTVNLEAIASGTPVITYRTGGSPEAINHDTGLTIEQGDVKGVAAAVETLCNSEAFIKEKRRKLCRIRAEQLFEKDACFKKYTQLYSELRGG